MDMEILMDNSENITKVLDFGNNKEKIEILELLSSTNDVKTIQKIIAKLDDKDIQVRGEAFSSLMLNENRISEVLIKNLRSTNKDIRGFTALILANRNESTAIPEIIKLTHDQHAMVRACALGALGYLKAQEAKDVIDNCLLDSSLEVRKSALQAIINLEESLPEKKIKEISMERDLELERLLSKVKREVDRKGFEPSI
jgi:HEAT repeat protein